MAEEATGRRRGRPGVAEEVDLLIVVEEAGVHLAEGEGLGGEGARELERRRDLRPSLPRDHRLQAPRPRHLRPGPRPSACCSARQRKSPQQLARHEKKRKEKKRKELARNVKERTEVAPRSWRSRGACGP